MGGNFMEMFCVSRVELPSIVILPSVCLLWLSLASSGASPIVPARLSGLHPQPPASCRLRVSCPGLSFTVHPLLAQLGLGAKRTWTYLGGSGVYNMEQTQESYTLPRFHQSQGHLTHIFHSPSRTYWNGPIEHRHVGVSIETIYYSRSLLPKAILLLRHPIPHPHYWVIGPGWTLGPELFP